MNMRLRLDSDGFLHDRPHHERFAAKKGERAMTPIKLFAAIIGTALVLATAATSAEAETYQRNGQWYNDQRHIDRQHYDHRFVDRRFTDQRRDYRHVAPRRAVYVVPARDLRRYVARNGRHSLHGKRFKRWVVSHGRPLRRHTASFRHNDFGFGWHRPRQPRWAYVNLRTGRIWF
jgi:hypothetical protein